MKKEGCAAIVACASLFCYFRVNDDLSCYGRGMDWAGRMSKFESIL